MHAQTAILQLSPHFLSALASAISREAPVSEATRFGRAATAAQLSRKVRTRSQFVPQMRKAGIGDADIRRITQDNPRRFLAFVPRS